MAADAERQAGPARIARAGGRRIRPRRIRSAAGRKRRSTGRDLAGAAACGARQPPRQLLRTRRPLAAGYRRDRTHAPRGAPYRRTQHIQRADVVRPRGARANRRSIDPGTAEPDSRARHAHHARHAAARRADPDADRHARGAGRRRRRQHTGHLSARAIAGRHGIPPSAACRKRCVHGSLFRRLPYAGASRSLPRRAADDRRSARHPAHRLFLGGTRAAGADRAASRAPADRIRRSRSG
ncbi:Uncharacterised protein [Burkholderia pseudomallei]|nr:hypothetical protein X976_6116 [Burkholderia pseudomallei MSHR7500]VBW41119.1 Uncharacterised protein [Burkholderia pseudomallei]VCM22893.1 Uncharacterised protein [Burkholderia pseudomallei]VCO26120.1 Uncharacterised protein [Burkholderia pseudomallei]